MKRDGSAHGRQPLLRAGTQGGIVGVSLAGQELDSEILVGPF